VVARDERLENCGWEEKENGEEPKTALHRLDYHGLVQVAEMIERLRQAGRCAAGAKEMTCEPEEDGYDEKQASVKKSPEVKS
jgi:hypothetical protein